jgi:hypothetical protein
MKTDGDKYMHWQVCITRDKAGSFILGQSPGHSAQLLLITGIDYGCSSAACDTPYDLCNTQAICFCHGHVKGVEPASDLGSSSSTH